jgi:hypothetical protein
VVDGFARSCRRLAGMRSERRPTGANRPRQARGQAPRSGGARAGLRSNLPGIPGFRSSSSWVFSRYWRFGMGPLPTVSATTVHSHRPFRRLVAGEQAVRSDITAPQAVPERMAASNSCSTAVQLDSSRRSTLLTSRVYAGGMKRCTPAGVPPDSILVQVAPCIVRRNHLARTVHDCHPLGVANRRLRHDKQARPAEPLLNGESD